MVRAGLVMLALLLAGASGASAQVATPEPCNGVAQITDANDVTASDKDILSVFFRFDAGKATANVVLEDADPALASSATNGYWRVLYDVGATRYWVGLQLTKPLPIPSDATFTYQYGTHSNAFTGDTQGFTVSGTTTGQVFDGVNGVLQIDIPTAAGGTEGTKLVKPVAVVREGNQASGAFVEYAPGGTDPAVSTTFGDDYTVGPCVPAVDPGPDGDGVPQDRDNCPGANNPGQEDLDQDGQGDPCDTDDDADTVTDADEAARGSDPRKPDTDGDGVRDDKDGCPVAAHATSDGCPAPASPPPPLVIAPGPSASAILITSGPANVVRGQRYLVEGRVDPPRPSVPLEVAGVDAAGRVVTSVTAITGSDGTFSVQIDVPRTMAVVARVEKTFSKPVIVRLIPSVSLKPKVSKRRKGGRFTVSFTGKTTPSLTGTVTIQRQVGSRWTKVKSGRVRRGKYAITRSGLKKGRYRAQVVESGVPQVKALSPPRNVR